MSLLQMDKKEKDALLEGFKKAACVTTNAAMFFFLPPWVFGDSSWFPADPVWAHITITMLCELDTMDRLNEKIILRTAGTTLGALSGCIMTFSFLSDWHRLCIIAVWVMTLGVIEKKNPSRSYTWTIATVTFGICTYLGRMGKFMTPWKRWFSIVLGTLVCCVWLLLLPWLGLLPRKIIRDDLAQTAKSAVNGSMSMLEDAMENPGDEEAGKRIADKQVSVHGALGKWPAAWKQYKFARNWLDLQPKKPLPMDGLQALLKGPIFELFLSNASAARTLHRSASSSSKGCLPAMRIEVHKVSVGLTSVVQVAATKDAPEPQMESGMKELLDVASAIESMEKLLKLLPAVQQMALAAAMSDMTKVVLHLKGLLQNVAGSSSVTDKCNKLLTGLAIIESGDDSVDTCGVFERIVSGGSVSGA